MSEKFQVAKLSEMRLPDSNRERSWWAIRSHFDIRSFGINAWSAPEPGMEIINEHDERDTRHEELYLVIEGRAKITVDGETIDAPSGTAVFVREPAARRGAVAEEGGTTVLTVGARAGEVFEPSAWERSAPALAYFASQEYDKAYDALTQVHRETPDDATVLYNLACVESLTGRTDEAIAHLGEAIGRESRFRELAQKDSDFDPIRDDPRFSELVG